MLNVSNLSPNVTPVNVRKVNFRADNNARRYTPAMTAEQQMAEFQKERKNQKKKQNISLISTILITLAIVGSTIASFVLMKGGGDSLRNKAEKEATRLIPFNLKSVKKRPKGTYSKEAQTFLDDLEGLLTRPDVEAKGEKRIASVQIVGPGGTGKTEIARNIGLKVEELFPGSEYYEPNLSMLSNNSWAGQNTQMISEYTTNFNKRADKLAELSAKDGKKRYVVMFLDEFDKIAMQDNGFNKHSSNKEIGALKTLINDTLKRDNVILVSATNYPELIENAVDSRLSKKILMDYLNPEQIRLSLVEHYKTDVKPGMVANELLDAGNEKLKQICEILGKPEHEMEYRKLYVDGICKKAMNLSPVNKPIDLKAFVEALTDDSIARTINLTPEEIVQLRNILA